MSENVEQKLWERVYKFLPVLRWIPFLRMVAVCNNLAFGKVDEKSDIDLFFVAKRGRLFIVRTLVVLFLHFSGVRRHGNKIAGRFCLSFFVDDSFLNLSKIAIRNDIYLAYWIKTMVPVMNDGIYSRFIEKNEWIEEYFESGEKYGRPRILASFRRGFLHFMLDGFFGDFVEFLLKKWQMRRASKKMLRAGPTASIIVDEHVLKFHNIDRRLEYKKKWVDKYGDSAKLTRGKFLAL